MPFFYCNNARIWTGTDRMASSMLIDSGRIVSLDPENVPAETLKVDLGGKFVMPSFADGHAHPL
jgi:predicted amidohydrolase YtcJ